MSLEKNDEYHMCGGKPEVWLLSSELTCAVAVCNPLADAMCGAIHDLFGSEVLNQCM